MCRRLARLGILAAACLAGISMGLPGVARSQDMSELMKSYMAFSRTARVHDVHEVSERMKASMALIKADAEKMGTPKLEGTEKVAGKVVPALYFGATKMNNHFVLVDDVATQSGVASMTVDIFVKIEDGFVKIATSAKNADGSRETAMPFLDSRAVTAIGANQAFYGYESAYGNNGVGYGYEAGYEPIYDDANKVIGIFHVNFVAGIM
jgi:hypothetical protein